MGSDIREIEVVADPAKLAQQQMTYANLAQAIQAATGVTAVGRMPQDYRQYLIVTTTEAHSASDIANIIVWPKTFETFRPTVLGARLEQ